VSFLSHVDPEADLRHLPHCPRSDYPPWRIGELPSWDRKLRSRITNNVECSLEEHGFANPRDADELGSSASVTYHDLQSSQVASKQFGTSGSVGGDAGDIHSASSTTTECTRRAGRDLWKAKPALMGKPPWYYRVNGGRAATETTMNDREPGARPDSHGRDSHSSLHPESIGDQRRFSFDNNQGFGRHSRDHLRDHTNAGIRRRFGLCPRVYNHTKADGRFSVAMISSRHSRSSLPIDATRLFLSGDRAGPGQILASLATGPK